MDVAHSRAPSLSKDEAISQLTAQADGGVAPGDQDCLDDAVMCPAATEDAGHSEVPCSGCTRLDRFSVKHGILFSLFGQMFSPKSGSRGLATLIPIQGVSCKSFICNDILTGIGFSTCLECSVLTGR